MPLPSWAHWRNNSGIELRFVLILTMVFKVISLNNSPCLWSVQVPCRCLAHPPISLDVLLYRLWFKFVLPVIIWSNFTRYGLFLCRPAPDDYIVRLCWFPWCLVYSLRASPRCPIGSSWSYQKCFLTFLCCRTQTLTQSSWRGDTEEEPGRITCTACHHRYITIT